MTSHCKRHCLLKFARRIMRMLARLNMTATCPRRAKNQVHQNEHLRLTQVVFDLEAKMGSMLKAMTRAGISFDKSPNEPQPREQSANGKQKGKFKGTAKMKNKANKIAQRSLAPVPNRSEVSDSDDEPQPEYGYVAIVAKPKKKHVCPRTMNAILVGMTRRDPDMRRISDSEASVDRASASDEIDA